jgi:hypothetical protein
MLGSLIFKLGRIGASKKKRWDELHERKEEIQPKTKLTQTYGNLRGQRVKSCHGRRRNFGRIGGEEKREWRERREERRRRNLCQPRERKDKGK